MRLAGLGLINDVIAAASAAVSASATTFGSAVSSGSSGGPWAPSGALAYAAAASVTWELKLLPILLGCSPATTAAVAATTATASAPSDVAPAEIAAPKIASAEVASPEAHEALVERMYPALAAQLSHDLLSEAELLTLFDAAMSRHEVIRAAFVGVLTSASWAISANLGQSLICHLAAHQRRWVRLS